MTQKIKVLKTEKRTSPPLSDTDLAKRWKVSLRTIQRWRQAGRVPTYLSLGRQVSYRQEDVAEYEAAARIRAGVPQ